MVVTVMADGPDGGTFRRRAGDLVRRPEPCGAVADRQRWFRGAGLGGVLALGLQYWMLTAGTWNPLRWDRGADFYDVQARSILHGTLAMDQRVLGIEAFGRGDDVYMYFGPVPALLRMPIVGFTQRFDGRLGAMSMLLALVVTLAVVAPMAWRIRTRLLDDRATSRWEVVGAGGLMFMILGGSSLLFALSRTWVYHEAIVWGVALTMASYAALLLWLDGNGRRFLGWASIAAVLAMLTRPSIGGGAVAALGAVAAGFAVLRLMGRFPQRTRWLGAFRMFEREPDGGSFGLAVAAVALPVATYAFVNWLKFRTLFSVPFDRQGYTLLSAQRQAMLEANGGSLFNVRFLPTNLVGYLRPDTLSVTTQFPFFRVRLSSFTIGSPVYDLIDLTTGIPVMMPLLVGLALVGAWGVVRTHHSTLFVLRPVLLGCLLGTLAVLNIGYLANRYQSDFLPLIVILALCGSAMLTRWLSDRRRSTACGDGRRRGGCGSVRRVRERGGRVHLSARLRADEPHTAGRLPQDAAVRRRMAVGRSTRRRQAGPDIAGDGRVRRGLRARGLRRARTGVKACGRSMSSRCIGTWWNSTTARGDSRRRSGSTAPSGDRRPSGRYRSSRCPVTKRTGAARTVTRRTGAARRCSPRSTHDGIS